MPDKEFIPAHKHPAFAMMPSVTGKPKKKSATNSLTDAIIKMVIMEFKGAARRVNNIGRTIKGKTVDKGFGYEVKEQDKFIPSSMKKGFEDVDAVVPVYFYNGRIKIGLKVAFEVKVGKDTQSKEQKERQKEVLSAGGLYIIAKTIDQCRNDLISQINKLKIAPQQL